ncbi:S-adenosyl-L-methionine-dependent methyltransferase [Anaeromyces robustus]|uniref:S-adenosyl-L-methionine-dependent methyltransferase n=1 Tax=Anaeromyces robustus TaxID=1754192 RepID=A0A1Y1XMH9_9FUNG|nr:S-adenosyl-L-methionine-dependent methyltransferase [Anaeromyces robustus]|eukprot:ORX86913.1 S-adenosyl-L-methionine-dependent methyltransferase [Anaeromyces robustus]
MSSPGFYIQAAKILDKLALKKTTIKAVTLADDVKEKKKMYAIINETLKYKPIITEIIEKSQILKNEKKLSKSLAIILIYDLLFGHAKNFKNAPVFQKIMNKNKARLNAELVKIKIRNKAINNEDLLPEEIKNPFILPRYVRVNLLKSTVDKVVNYFQKNDGYTLLPAVEGKELAHFKPKTFRKDFHLHDLLVFPSNTDFHDHPLYIDGTLILQDKASCFPAHVLSPPPGSVVIDGCAAPGNKTSHVASLMGNKGHIFAFDLDKRRLGLLKRLTTKAGCTCIEPINENFLETDPNDPKYANVEYILLDPSCSGSGIVSRLDQILNQKSQDTSNKLVQERLKSLSDFQLSTIQHAFKFPNVKRISYSTCSIHQIENEDVVRRALESTKEFKLSAHCIPQWKRRGLDGSVENANYVARTLPEEDYVIGFFVSCFERINPNENNNKKIENDNKEDISTTKDDSEVDEKNDDDNDNSSSNNNSNNNNNNLGVLKTTGSIKKKKNKKKKNKKNKNKKTIEQQT